MEWLDSQSYHQIKPANYARSTHAATERPNPDSRAELCFQLDYNKQCVSHLIHNQNLRCSIYVAEILRSRQR